MRMHYTVSTPFTKPVIYYVLTFGGRQMGCLQLHGAVGFQKKRGAVMPRAFVLGL